MKWANLSYQVCIFKDFNIFLNYGNQFHPVLNFTKFLNVVLVWFFKHLWSSVLFALKGIPPSSCYCEDIIASSRRATIIIDNVYIYIYIHVYR